MKTLTFKTTINCSGCVAKVTPFLNSLEGVKKWEVDTTNPDKILTVETFDTTDQDVVDTVKKSGFSIEPVLTQ